MSANVTRNENHFIYNFNAEVLAYYVGAIAVILSVTTLLIKLIARPRVVVNCWFCNTNSRVASRETNNWYCPNCEQYNGFLSNGDYNKDIPEQRQGHPGKNFAHKSKVSLDCNGLCDECNDKQDIKVRHLAAFQALVPSNYEEELKIYCNQLENAYRLCQKCERVVSDTLDRKKSLVLGMQLLQSGKDIKGRKKYFKYPQQGLYQISLTALATATCMMTVTSAPFFKNFDYPILKVIQEQVESNYHIVLAASFVLQLLLTLCTARKLPLVVCCLHIGTYLLRDKFASVGNNSHAMIVLSGLTLFLTLCSKRTSKSAFVKIKKLDKSAMTSKTVERERTFDVRPPIVKPMMEEFKMEREEKERESINRPLASTSSMTTTNPRQQQDDNSSVDSAFSTHDSVTQDGDSIRGDVDSLTQSLSEWDSRVVDRERPRTPNSRHEFQSRQYKPVLNPARLSSPRSLNESSWVAGGFWQNHQNEPDQSTSRPPSRPPSRPGSPNCSVYSQASSPSMHAFELPRPATPTQAHYPMYMAYGPPNGFQQPYGYQPYMYPPPAAPIVNPMWNSALFQPIAPSSPTTPSSVSCSSASTCGSVRRRDRFSDVTSCNIPHQHLRISFLESLWNNSSVILYTSAFYVAVFAIVVFVYRKW